MGPSRAICLVVAAGLGAGCAGLEGPAHGVYDPAEGFNRRAHAVSEALDRFALRPVARGYHIAVPRPVRLGIRNFFDNLRGLDSAANGLLQGKPRQAGVDLMRVVVNSTLGLGGLFDVATDLGLAYGGEDLGQTLAVWGYTRTRYVYVPAFGPSSVRDIPGLGLRAALPWLLLGDSYNLAVGALDVTRAREDALDATDARDRLALDPYSFTREAYFQRRRYQIYDGAPPFEDFLDPDFEDAIE